MKNSTKKYIIVAAGTGGHIIPSIVFGKWLEEKIGKPCQYYTGNRALEKDIFDFYGCSPKRLPLQGSPLGVRGLASFLRWIALGYIFLSLFFHLLFYRPKGIFLFGGYLCFPFLVVGKILRIPMVAHEQNALAGRITRLSAKLGVPVCTGWDETEHLPGNRSVFTGIPVRSLENLHVSQAWNKLVPDLPFPKSDIILVLGGSLGSPFMESLALKLAESQAYGSYFYLLISESHDRGEGKKFPENIIQIAPQWNMGPVYTLASLVISRAGGSTLAELFNYGIPSVVIPFGKALDNHQEKNARAFKNLGRAEIWKEEEPFGELEKKLSYLLSLENHVARHQGCDREASILPSQKILDVFIENYSEGDTLYET